MPIIVSGDNIGNYDANDYDTILDYMIDWYNLDNPQIPLNLTRWQFNADDELPDMPPNVEILDICWIDIKHLKGLPPNLKKLICNRSQIETIELPLPPNLKYIEALWCENMKPFDVPKGVKLISHIDKYERERKYEKERLTEDHNIVAKRRIQEWIEENKDRKYKSLLNLRRLQIKELPEGIPSDIKQINLGGNFVLTSLKGLPINLKSLLYDGCPFKEFRDLPPNLEYLRARGSDIRILDNIPNTVKRINMSYYSKLRVIKSFPSELRILNLAQADRLQGILCEFPPKLREIDMELTRVKKIPRLPDSLELLSLYVNSEIQEIPNLPRNLKKLYLDGCHKIQSLPLLPEGLEHLSIEKLSILNNNSLPNSIRYFKCDELILNDSYYYN